ncbi:Leucine-rich_repeat domain superfamily [Hexamita inflata]|uniref:Leucine-rich repeat domain superfamily n=1 Tax=Hexamita inflata TaxID=28002 RepID=A0AA86PJY8_9EUKA|nr:Leucine-rich repeat domain superfamily [Hexamita inflata]
MSYDVAISFEVTLCRFTNISSLNIDGNQVNNIWPLKNLPLEELRICNNGLVDISVVKYLTKLKKIDYVYNYITNIDALSNRHIVEITTKTSKYLCNNQCLYLKANPSKEELYFFLKRVIMIFKQNNQIREINEKRKSKQIIFNRQKNVVAEKLIETLQKQIFFTSNVLNLFRKME